MKILFLAGIVAAFTFTINKARSKKPKRWARWGDDY